MLFLVVVIPVAIACLITWLTLDETTHNKGGYSSYLTPHFITAIWLSIITGILIVVMLGATFVNWSDQVSINSQIDTTYKNEKVQNSKAVALIPEFKTILETEYPQFEKTIFDKISSPGQIQAFLVQYPQLQTSKTLMDLVARINALRSAVYDQQTKRNNLIQRAEVKKNSPWVLGFLVPEPHK